MYGGGVEHTHVRLSSSGFLRVLELLLSTRYHHSGLGARKAFWTWRNHSPSGADGFNTHYFITSPAILGIVRQCMGRTGAALEDLQKLRIHFKELEPQPKCSSGAGWPWASPAAQHSCALISTVFTNFLTFSTISQRFSTCACLSMGMESC